MNNEIYEKLSKINELLIPFYHCKFITGKTSTILGETKYLNLWIQTHKSNKELVAGFIPDDRTLDYGPCVRLSRVSVNNVGDKYIHNKIMANYDGITFISKPNILISRGPASATYKVDTTVDIIPHHYQNKDSYVELKQALPNIEDDMLTAIYYFFINPMPKRIQLELDIKHLDMVIINLEHLLKRIA